MEITTADANFGFNFFVSSYENCNCAKNILSLQFHYKIVLELFFAKFQVARLLIVQVDLH